MPEPREIIGMADRPGGGVAARLLQQGWRFDFFQATWLLERLFPDREPVGFRGPVEKEAISFRPHVGMGFPSTDIRRVDLVEPPGHPPVARMETTFLGLYGVATPLPLHYAVEMVRSVAAASTPDSEHPESSRNLETEGNTPERDFLDLIHHRVTSLFYRAWTKYRYHVAFGQEKRDVITDYLMWLLGLQPQWRRSLLGVEPLRLIRYAGMLTQHPRSASSLEGMLTDYWDGTHVRVQQFQGRWVPLKPDDLNALGAANCGLGTDFTVGGQVFDLSGSFNIVVGPLDWVQFQRFTPDGDAYAQTRALVMLYCEDPLAFTLEAELLPGQVPEMQLTSGLGASKLGYTSWVRTGDMPATSVKFETTWISPAKTRGNGQQDRDDAGSPVSPTGARA